MRRIILLWLICSAIAKMAVCQNFQPCEVIITKGLREYRIDTSSSTYLRNVFDNYCEASGSMKSSSLGVGLDLVVKAIPISLTGDYSSTEQAMRSFCKTYASQTHATQASSSYEETIVNKAYESFNQCLRFIAQGVSVEHDVVSLAASSFFLWAGVNKPIKIQGVTTSPNVSCSGQDPSGKLITYTPKTTVLAKDTLGFTCWRSSEKAADGRDVFNEATVQIVTNYGNYNVFLPRDETLPENQASVIAKRLDALQQATEIAHSRLDGLRITTSDNRALPDFACGQEAVTNDDVTFMVGSRDGTGCDVRNVNFVRTLLLRVPPR